MNSQKINAAINAIIPCYDGIKEYNLGFCCHKGLRNIIWERFPPNRPPKWVPLLHVFSDAENTVKLTLRLKDDTVTYDLPYPRRIEENIIADIVEIAKRINILKRTWRIADNPEWTPSNGTQHFILGAYWDFAWAW